MRSNAGWPRGGAGIRGLPTGTPLSRSDPPSTASVAPIPPGSQLVAEVAIANLFEKKGHEFVDLDLSKVHFLQPQGYFRLLEAIFTFELMHCTQHFQVGFVDLAVAILTCRLWGEEFVKIARPVAYGVDADVELLGHGLGVADDTGLGCRVVGLPEFAPQPVDRGEGSGHFVRA